MRGYGDDPGVPLAGTIGALLLVTAFVSGLLVVGDGGLTSSPRDVVDAHVRHVAAGEFRRAWDLVATPATFDGGSGRGWRHRKLEGSRKTAHDHGGIAEITFPRLTVEASRARGRVRIVHEDGHTVERRVQLEDRNPLSISLFTTWRLVGSGPTRGAVTW